MDFLTYMDSLSFLWNFKTRRKSNVTNSGDKGTYVIIYSYYSWIYFVVFNRLNKNRQDLSWDTFFAIGVVLIVIGLVIRIQSLWTLKQYFTYSVSIIEIIN